MRRVLTVILVVFLLLVALTLLQPTLIGSAHDSVAVRQDLVNIRVQLGYSAEESSTELTVVGWMILVGLGAWGIWAWRRRGKHSA